MDYFINEFYDDDGGALVLYSFVYYTTPKKYCYRKVFVDGILKNTKRLSESSYLSAYDTHCNY